MEQGLAASGAANSPFHPHEPIHGGRTACKSQNATQRARKCQLESKAKQPGQAYALLVGLVCALGVADLGEEVVLLVEDKVTGKGAC